MIRYVKKPLPIEALRFTRLLGEDWDDAFDRLSEFTDESVIWQTEDFTGADTFKVYDYLHDTWVIFEPEDWILKGIQGEFYPCKADIFAQTYEVYHE